MISMQLATMCVIWEYRNIIHSKPLHTKVKLMMPTRHIVDATKQVNKLWVLQTILNIEQHSWEGLLIFKQNYKEWKWHSIENFHFYTPHRLLDITSDLLLPLSGGYLLTTPTWYIFITGILSHNGRLLTFQEKISKLFLHFAIVNDKTIWLLMMQSVLKGRDFKIVCLLSMLAMDISLNVTPTKRHARHSLKPFAIDFEYLLWIFVQGMVWDGMVALVWPFLYKTLMIQYFGLMYVSGWLQWMDGWLICWSDNKFNVCIYVFINTQSKTHTIRITILVHNPPECVYSE